MIKKMKRRAVHFFTSTMELATIVPNKGSDSFERHATIFITWNEIFDETIRTREANFNNIEFFVYIRSSKSSFRFTRK